MKNNVKMGISIGGPTIIMIFVVLCMTTLGTLSLVTANADYKLTQKTVDSTAAYYAADNQGELFLSQVDAIANQASAVELLGKIPETTAIKNSDGSLFITHIIKVSDAQKLLIEISASSAADERYTINTWKVVNKDYWRYEDYETQFQDAIPQNE